MSPTLWFTVTHKNTMQAMAALPGFLMARHSSIMGMSISDSTAYRAGSIYRIPSTSMTYTINTPATPPIRVPVIRLMDDSMVLPAEFCTHTTAAIME